MRSILNLALGCFLIFPLSAFGQSGQSGQSEPDVSQPDPDPQATASNVNTVNTGTSAPASTYVFPTNRQIVRFGYRGVAGFRTLIGNAVTTSWSTWVTDEPEEWGEDASGWGKRFGVKVLDSGINQGTLVLLSIATHRDPVYYRCACTGFWPRTGHAIQMTYKSRDRQGDLRFSIGDMVSPFVGPIITRNTIYPKRFDTVDGLKSGAYYILGTAGWNLVREFFLKGPKW